MQQVLGQQKGKTTEPTAAAMDEGEGTPVGPPEEKEPTPNGDRAHSSGEEDDEESTEEDAQGGDMPPPPLSLPLQMRTGWFCFRQPGIYTCIKKRKLV